MEIGEAQGLCLSGVPQGTVLELILYNIVNQ